MKEEEGIAELLKPRVKVEVDYPNSPFRIGDILQLIKSDKDCWQNFRTGQCHYVDVKHYKEVFKELFWWEDRKEEELPEYVRNKENGKVKKLAAFLKDYNFFLNEYLPATQSEYNNQK